MTKKEMAMFEELTNRIEKLEKLLKAESKNSRTSTEKSKANEVVVGNLVFSGKYVKTGSGYMSSKTRYAIGMAITEKFGGVKLAKGNPVFDKCHKADKYVQVYEFKSESDCKKFMAEQKKRVG